MTDYSKENITKRGGLRNPSGGRPQKAIEEKYQVVPLKLPPDIVQWLRDNTDNRNGFIVELLRNVITSKCDEAAYKVLSDSSVSKTTASMSEEGREAVANRIANKLVELLSE